MYGMPRGGNEEEACVCLRQGLWAVMTDYCTVPVEMHGVGGVGRRVCVLKEGKGRRNTSSGGGQVGYVEIFGWAKAAFLQDYVTLSRLS